MESEPYYRVAEKGWSKSRFGAYTRLLHPPIHIDDVGAYDLDTGTWEVIWPHSVVDVLTFTRLVWGLTWDELVAAFGAVWE